MISPVSLESVTINTMLRKPYEEPTETLRETVGNGTFSSKIPEFLRGKDLEWTSSETIEGASNISMTAHPDVRSRSLSSLLTSESSTSVLVNALIQNLSKASFAGGASESVRCSSRCPIARNTRVRSIPGVVSQRIAWLREMEPFTAISHLPPTSSVCVRALTHKDTRSLRSLGVRGYDEFQFSL